MIKKFFLTSRWVLICCLAFVTSSCCTMMYCIGADDMDNIHFNNFQNSELDTITIQRFPRNNNYVGVLEEVDVVTSVFSEESNFQRIQLPVKMTADYDYKVKLISTGAVYTISDFVTKKEDCNTGFMCNDSFNALESYMVNGNKMSTYQIAISK